MSESARAEAPALRQRAANLLDLHRYDEALQVIGVGLAQYPEDAELLCQGAVANLNLDRLDECRQLARRAAAADPDHTWPLRLIALAELRMGLASQAVEPVKAAIRLAPYEWQTQVVAARVCANLPQYRDAALDAAQRAVELGPNETETHLALGFVYYSAGNMKAARAAYLDALRIDPSSSVALNELGRIKLKRRDHFGAAEHFAQAAGSDVRQDVFARNLDVALGAAVGWLFLWLWVLVLTLGRLAVSVDGQDGRQAGWAMLVALAALLAWQGWRIGRGLRGRRVRGYVRQLPRRDRPLTGSVALMLLAVVALVVLGLLPPTGARSACLGVAIVAMLASRILLAVRQRRMRSSRNRPTRERRRWWPWD